MAALRRDQAVTSAQGGSRPWRPANCWTNYATASPSDRIGGNRAGALTHGNAASFGSSPSAIPISRSRPTHAGASTIRTHVSRMLANSTSALALNSRAVAGKNGLE